MKIVVQRVKKASVTVSGRTVGAIEQGLVLLVGIAPDDTPDTTRQVALKIGKLRIFEDAAGKMNLDVTEISGSVLSVPQFTLLADTRKGNRPGFEGAADPAHAKSLWELFNDSMRSDGIPVSQGEFGAHMEVSLINDGPVTFIVDSKCK